MSRATILAATRAVMRTIAFAVLLLCWVNVASAEGRCDYFNPAGSDLSGCRTPRDTTPSGGYLALDAGFFTIESKAEDRTGLRTGPVLDLRLGVEFWDQMILAFAVGSYLPVDKRGFTETVVDCTQVGTADPQCSDEPYEASSVVNETFINFEIGYQHRFRPWQSSSWSPGLMFGYQHAFGVVERGVPCKGCATETIPIDLSGPYLAPFFRITVGNVGEAALIARSQWFASSDVVQMTTLGFEYGLP